MSNPKKKKGCLKPLFIILVVVAFCVVVFNTPQNGNTKSKSNDYTPMTEAEIKAEVKTRLARSFLSETKHQLKQQFKDPDSVKFKQVKYIDASELGEVIFGYVNAKNSFGAYTGFERFISNGKTTFLESKEESFAEIWAKLR